MTYCQNHKKAEQAFSQRVRREMQQAGVRRDEARIATAKLVRERRRLRKRFGPDLDIKALIVPLPGGGVSTALTWPKADLDPTMRDVSASMCEESLRRAFAQ